MSGGKTCRECGLTKTVDNFYRHPTCADGRLYICKPCHIAKGEERRKADPDTHRERARAYREANPEQFREYARDSYKRRKAWYLSDQRDRRAGEGGRQMMNARAAVYRAVKKGDLVRQPCEGCGATDNIDGHHEDYSRPLDVSWLCRRCHKRLHANVRSEATS